MKHFSLILIFAILGFTAFAQTPGLIVKPAVGGQSVLDPNTDGYVSSDAFGFVSDDETETEIPYVSLVLPSGEPTGDVAQGPACGFADLVDDAGSYSSVYSYLDASNNFLFRFRLGNYAQNSKGYSILIDADSKFGETGPDADPNYIEGNPGFEIEIELVTNIGIKLFDVNGTTSPTLKSTLSYDDYCQKSIALSTNCANADYFYDFYIPFSEITTYFTTVTTATPLRMAASTVISTQTAIASGPTDVAGVDDGACGNDAELMWTKIIDASVPTSATAINDGLPAVRAEEPVVSGPIAGGATSVTGTSTVVANTTITLYVDGVEVGTTVADGAGAWTFTGLTALNSTEVVTATAQGDGESVSLLSNGVIVGATCSDPPALTCNSTKGMTGTGPVGAPINTTIRIYGPNNPTTLLATELTDAVNEFLYNCTGGTSCAGGGAACIDPGVYWLTAEETTIGKCESERTEFVCSGTGGPTADPTVTTSPVETTTTSLSGTGPAGSTIMLFVNGYFVSQVVESSGWTLSSLSFALGDVIKVYAIETVGTKCQSNPVTINVTGVSDAPVVNSPIINGATSVSGTSTEAEGTSIEIFVDGGSVGTTTVDAFGNWTITGLTALTATQVVKAKATATGKTVSIDSNLVTVQSISATPTLTGSYAEGDTQIDGTLTAANGTVINIYIDGVLVGFTTVSSNAWSLTGIDPLELYPGGTITARAVEVGKAESVDSNAEVVSCSNPGIGMTVNVVANNVCVNDSATIEVLSSESGVIYVLRNNANTIDRGYSVLGTGGTINLGSVRITANETFKVKAIKIPSISCNDILTSTASVTATYPPDVSGIANGDYFWTGSTGDLFWNNVRNWVQYDGTNFNVVTVSPAVTNNVIIKPIQQCVTSQPTVNTSSGDALPGLCKDLTIDVGGALTLENSGSERAITISGNWLNKGTFIPNSGTIKFNGGIEQTINNTGGSETFSSVIIDGGSTVVKPLVDVTCNATGILTLNQGVLDLNSNKWTMSNNSSVAIARVAPGYVKSESQNGSGELRWNLSTTTATDYIFPLGDASANYIPLTMNLTSGNIGIAGVATVNSNPSSSGTWPTGAEAVGYVNNPTHVVERFWHLYSDQTVYDVSVTFTYHTSEDPAAGVTVTDTDDIKFKRWNGSDWEGSLSGQVYTHADRTVNVPSITGFSWWGGGNNGQNALPIELASFDGQFIEKEVLLTWETLSEINNDYFVIEKSYDGIKFGSIDTVLGAGNSSLSIVYQTIDNDQIENQMYYRLLQVDFNGDYKYSEVISVVNRQKNHDDISIFPNPVHSVMSINFSDNRAKTINIYSINGSLVHSETTNAHSSVVSMQNNPKGIYFIEVIDSNNILRKKVVVE